eukprot:1714129-Pleurochrysis_carterae.AAC.1
MGIGTGICALALEPASLAAQVVLGGVVVEGDRLSGGDRPQRDERRREVLADDNLAVGLARVAEEVVEVVLRQRR